MLLRPSTKKKQLRRTLQSHDLGAAVLIGQRFGQSTAGGVSEVVLLLFWSREIWCIPYAWNLRMSAGSFSPERGPTSHVYIYLNEGQFTPTCYVLEHLILNSNVVSQKRILPKTCGLAQIAWENAGMAASGLYQANILWRSAPKLSVFVFKGIIARDPTMQSVCRVFEGTLPFPWKAEAKLREERETKHAQTVRLAKSKRFVEEMGSRSHWAFNVKSIPMWKTHSLLVP